MSAEASRRTALKLMAMGSIALTHPGSVSELASITSPAVNSPKVDHMVAPEGFSSEVDRRAEGEPDAFEMLNRINRLHGERGTQMVEIDGVTYYAEVLPLGGHNAEIVSETSTMRDGSPYQVGRISFIPDDDESDLSYTAFNFDSSGRVWVETPALRLSDIDLQSEEGVRYMIESLDWYEKALQFSPSTVWRGVDEAVRLLDEPDASSTFVQDHIETMVGWDEIDPINMRFFPDDYEFEIIEQGSELLAYSDPEDERELDEAMASYQRGEFTRLTASDIRNRLTAIEEENSRVAEAWEKYRRGEGQVYSESDLEELIALKKAKETSLWKGGFSRAQLFHAVTVLGGEVKRIFQGGTYTALPDEVRQIFDVPVLPPQTDERAIPISSGFSFYDSNE